MTLEYLKVILTTPVMIAVVVLTFLLLFRADVKALMGRIFKVKFPGGEIEATQLEKAKEEFPAVGGAPRPTAQEGAPIVALPASPSGGVEQVQSALNAERANAQLWEFRYLNHFLARSTQTVLSWLAGISAPASFSLVNSMWLPVFPDPDERKVIIEVLKAHYLVVVEDDLIQISPKGRQYIEWRGPIPSPAMQP